jgi:hypothetical protein
MIYIIILEITYLNLTRSIHFAEYLNIHIRSEGYGDPDRTGGLGLGIIQVNGKDYSRHDRGHNFVTINASTGRISYFVFFPTLCS